jgi:hypothetical protein
MPDSSDGEEDKEEESVEERKKRNCEEKVKAMKNNFESII